MRVLENCAMNFVGYGKTMMVLSGNWREFV